VYRTVSAAVVGPVRLTVNRPVVGPASVAVASVAETETVSLLPIVTVALLGVPTV
jgi:hypothetical protein